MARVQYALRTRAIGAFPLSNWTEVDVWQYIAQEHLEVVPLYFAAPRPVVERAGTWLMVDDERMPLNAGERIVEETVRFRTLGCYPLTGAIESTARTVSEVIDEQFQSRDSERQGRLIDHDGTSCMEKEAGGTFLNESLNGAKLTCAALHYLR